ncbi:arsenate reductase (glutaredoxin) [Sphingobacterium sp.]|jgi:arsenate reductase|uniref:arsenate reductase (glutaredoxin) n=1 Tax=Sphingobacterium sp. TaxID=341027 RepID=UPI00289C1138|nr:arsenate reductase (glutaredoxin) [Sphingobacterium sp.]
MFWDLVVIFDCIQLAHFFIRITQSTYQTMIKIYHNINCSKSRTALEFLQQQADEIEVREYLNDVPTKDELKELLSQLRIKPLDLIRKGELLFQEKFRNSQLTDEEWIDVMTAYPILIERPIVVKNGVAVIGRPIEKVISLIEKSDK